MFIDEFTKLTKSLLFCIATSSVSEPGVKGSKSSSEQEANSIADANKIPNIFFIISIIKI
jgi:hypothetical protein